MKTNFDGPEIGHSERNCSKSQKPVQHQTKRVFNFETCLGLRLLSSLNGRTNSFSIYTLSDPGVLSNLIGSLSLANEHYSPHTE